MKVVVLLLVCITFANALPPRSDVEIYSVIAMHGVVSSGSIEAFKQSLLRAYRNHIDTSAQNQHKVAIVVDNEVALTWTESTQEDFITLAINNLPLSLVSGGGVCASTSYAAILDTCRTHTTLQGKTTNVYLVLDNVKDSASTPAVSITAANELIKKHNVKVYPLGIGPCINVQELKRIAGPCHPVFGCHPPFSYYQSHTYDGIQRAAIEEKQQEERHVITVTTADGLTTAQLAITIVFSVVIAVLAMWCLVYSCCYLPKQIPDYTMWAETASPIREGPPAMGVGRNMSVPSFVSSFRAKTHIV